METRAGLLEEEIAGLDQAGKRAEADERRVVLKRLRIHMDELKKAIDEAREPM
jgi:hypothetical protein